MGQSEAPQVPTVVVGEDLNFAVSFAGRLDSGETLTGTPTVAEVTTSDLTITNKVVSSASLTINDKTVTAAEAVQFNVSGFLAANSPYRVKITCGTTATPAQTLIGYVKFNVEA